MSNLYKALLSESVQEKIDESVLQSAIISSTVSRDFIRSVVVDDGVVCVFDGDLTTEDTSILDDIILNHSAVNLQAQIKLIISNAILYGNSLIIDFATENVLMGITQAGKTKEVADYLSDVTRYIQTGSLYEVMNEIDRLVSTGVPADLSPFITENRLVEFKQKIIDYLS